jgi:hypothetical protein
MKVTNGDIFGAAQVFTDILKIEFPVKTSWLLAKLASKVDSRFKNIDSVRRGLVAKYGQLNLDTKQTEIKPDSPDWENFVADFNELMEQEEEIDMDKIILPEEVNGKPVMITAGMLVSLRPFIDVISTK